MSGQNIAPETLQRLIDFAHAAMGKRTETPDEYPMNQSRRGNELAVIYAKDWREVMKLGKPSWEIGDQLREWESGEAKDRNGSVDYGSNAGIRCDSDDGPCACGAWH